MRLGASGYDKELGFITFQFQLGAIGSIAGDVEPSQSKLFQFQLGAIGSSILDKLA